MGPKVVWDHPMLHNIRVLGQPAQRNQFIYSICVFFVLDKIPKCRDELWGSLNYFCAE